MKMYQWQIVHEFDPKKDYAQRIPPRIGGILSLLKKDETLLSREFTEKNKEKIIEFLRVKTDRAVQKAVEAAFAVGVKIGIIRKLKGPNDGRIPYEEFCKIPQVSYWLSQLNSSNIKNLNVPKSRRLGTRGIYAYKLWNFHCWLWGKTFEFYRMNQIDEDKFVRKRDKITLRGVDHLLELYQELNSNSIDFVKIIKTYLLDTKKHQDNRVKTVELDSCAIKSFFKENDSEINYSFNAKSSYKFTDSETEERIMSLEDFFTILTVGRPTVTEKAIFLCKFHRGLDSITLADRFNFQAFDQIALYFKSSNHNTWDLDKCPIPVTLVRVKTDFKHTGFLDRDAIESLQKYLDHRLEKTGLPMKADEPLFLTKHNHPITTAWMEKQFNKLATNAGLQKKLKGYQHMNKYISHELRDLLKSTLIATGVTADVADHCVGHKPKDTYEKQDRLYPEFMRGQYMKASGKLNLFSNLSNNMKGNDEQVNRVTKLERQLSVTKSTFKEFLESSVEHPRIISGNGTVHPTQEEIQEYRRMNEALLKELDQI
ncbi:MAG: tyrosine-type recombinase/integrase [Thaumarchaeota archaeon]|nr:tyrosine-type recombinase/integrase [Nitrososphaerota archaeon]